MTEREYINVHELATIRAAERVLHDICPENSEGLITVDDYDRVLLELRRWRLVYEKRIMDARTP